MLNICDYIDCEISITDVISSIAIILTFLSLREIKKQRESMYIPDLFLENQYFFVSGFNLKDTLSYFTYNTAEKGAKKSDKKSGLNIDLNVFNIGFGSAKEIGFKWSYDVEKMLRLVNEKIDKKDFDFRCDKTFGSPGATIIHRKTSHFDSDHYDMFINHEASVVRPLQEKEQAPTVAIPSLYSLLLNYYICSKYETFKEDSKNELVHDNLDEIPTLYLDLTYFDIRNKKYLKKMPIKFGAFAWGDENEKNSERFAKKRLWAYSIDIKELR